MLKHVEMIQDLLQWLLSCQYFVPLYTRKVGWDLLVAQSLVWRARLRVERQSCIHPYSGEICVRRDFFLLTGVVAGRSRLTLGLHQQRHRTRNAGSRSVLSERLLVLLALVVFIL